MPSKPFPSTSTIILLLILLSRPLTSVSGDNSPPVCPYPCLPPPTSVTNCPPPPPSAPNPPTWGYPPPSPSTPEYGNYPPSPPSPPGYVPSIPPPYVNFPAPPPPNPILPYFPWYYKTPSSASEAPPMTNNVLGGSLVASLIMTLGFIVF